MYDQGFAGPPDYRHSNKLIMNFNLVRTKMRATARNILNEIEPPKSKAKREVMVVALRGLSTLLKVLSPSMESAGSRCSRSGL